MADAYQKSCFPGSVSLIADQETTPGGPGVLLQNLHASETAWLTGSSSTTALAHAFKLAAGKTVAVALGGGEKIYGFSGNATVTLTVAVFRTNFPSAGSIG
jgi:hypothetical protein